MANFAKIDENNIVQQVIVVSKEDCGGYEYPESDPIGSAFCNSLFGGTWIQTSYIGAFRGTFAGIGFTYDPINDIFIPPTTN